MLFCLTRYFAHKVSNISNRSGGTISFPHQLLPPKWGCSPKIIMRKPWLSSLSRSSILVPSSRTRLMANRWAAPSLSRVFSPLYTEELVCGRVRTATKESKISLMPAGNAAPHGTVHLPLNRLGKTRHTLQPLLALPAQSRTLLQRIVLQ